MEEDDPKHLLVKVARALEKAGVPYFVTGGLAVLVWGRPRFTADIDAVVQLAEPQIEKLIEELRSVLPSGYIEGDMIHDAVKRKDEFNVIDPMSGLKIDFWVAKDDELTREQFRRRIPKVVGGHDIFFVSPEDLILNKLDWYRESRSSRHIEDIESVFGFSGKALDRAYLETWSKKRGTHADLRDIMDRHDARPAS